MRKTLKLLAMFLAIADAVVAVDYANSMNVVASLARVKMCGCVAGEGAEDLALMIDADGELMTFVVSKPLFNIYLRLENGPIVLLQRRGYLFRYEYSVE